MTLFSYKQLLIIINICYLQGVATTTPGLISVVVGGYILEDQLLPAVVLLDTTSRPISAVKEGSCTKD